MVVFGWGVGGLSGNESVRPILPMCCLLPLFLLVGRNRLLPSTLGAYGISRIVGLDWVVGLLGYSATARG